jgi:hypothetical protein
MFLIVTVEPDEVASPMTEELVYQSIRAIAGRERRSQQLMRVCW